MSDDEEFGSFQPSWSQAVTCSLRTINWAPAMGWAASSFWRKRSAGGQLEQPSEVKSSIRTGFAFAADATGVPVLFSACRTRLLAAGARHKNAKIRNARVEGGVETVRDMGVVYHRLRLVWDSVEAPQKEKQRPRKVPGAES